MFNVLRQSVSGATLVQLAAELSWLFAVIVLVLRFDQSQPITHINAAPAAFVIAVVIVCLNGAFGLYGRIGALTRGAYFLRVLLAPAIGIPLALLVAQLMPVPFAQEDRWIAAILLALLGLLLVRHIVVLPLIARLLPHRVLVVGTGPEARLVESSLDAVRPLGIELVGFYGLDKMHDVVVSSGRVFSKDKLLEDVVEEFRVDEVIIAVQQQRGGVLPLRELLDCRLSGVEVTNLARHFERVHGQVPIETLKVSWLIYGEGFRQNVLRNFIKRSFDVVVSATLIALSLPVVLLAAALIRLESSGHVIYRQERVGFRGRTFTVLKLRSMASDAEKDGRATWASINDTRITRVGRFIRRARIDEIPQLLNVLKGEMSFVGPRPERPEFVAMLTEQIPFYAVRHSVKPGLTGWAQVRYSYGATVEQSIRKLEYDLYYVKNHTLLLDLFILLETVRVVLLGEGAR